MNPSREEALFALALQKSAGERTAFLARECAVDVGLRGGVERLHGTHLSLQRHPEMGSKCFRLKVASRLPRWRAVQRR